jgi:hypothetical protein
MAEQMEIGKQIDQLIAKMSMTKIETEADYLFAAGWLKELKATQKAVVDRFEPRRVEKYGEYQAVLDERNALTGRLDAAERAVKKIVKDYALEQDRKRAEEERLRRIEQDKAKKKEEDRLLSEAERTGDESYLNRPVIAPVAPVQTAAAPKVSGVSFAETWYAEVTDFKALVAAVAAGTVALSVLQPDQRVLGAMAKALKGSMSLPGVRVYSDKTVRAGAA